jgi:hypothetical protein
VVEETMMDLDQKETKLFNLRRKMSIGLVYVAVRKSGSPEGSQTERVIMRAAQSKTPEGDRSHETGCYQPGIE